MRPPTVCRVAASCLLVLSFTACGDDALEGDTGDDTVDALEVLGDTDPFDAQDTAEPETIVFDTFVPETTGDVTEEVDVPERTCNDNPKPFYCPCDVNTQCDSGYCIAVDEAEVAMRCSRTCQDTCPNGWECKGAGGIGDPVFICQPPIDTLCDPCEQSSDCQAVGARCIAFDDGKYCGRSCDQGDDNCPAGYACGEVLNDQGQIEAYQCMRTSGSCNCPDGTDYSSDPANCGFCGNACVYSHGVPGCAAEVCKLDGCEDAWKDLNQVESDGCEYPCTFRNADDWPDGTCSSDNDCDQNCDGIDGDFVRGIFVAQYGNGGASGAPYDPVDTIGRALQLAGGGKDHVYVAAGTYNESITLVEGVSIFGGYSNDGQWTRNLAQYKTTIAWSAGTNSVRVVIAEGIDAARTVLDGVEVVAGTNANPSGSSYAIWVKDSSSALEIRNVSAVGGNGGAGNPGTPGNPGREGEVGTKGKSSSENSDGVVWSDCTDANCNDEDKYGGPGGPGAPNVCAGGSNAAGGAGGKGACDSGGAGVRGDNSPGGAAGGPASTGNGNPGSPGGNGGPGSDGGGGTANGSVSGSGLWLGLDGGSGGIGGNGIGGGGGSGGGGDDGGTFGFAAWGGGGGGGGSGGCGGTGATGGKAGGGSFGIFLVNSSPILDRSAFGHKNGGNGGAGGTGGGGGNGKDGGAGGDACEDAFNGARGGKGGNGGRGGHGGGGAGGVAYGLYLTGSSDPVCTNLSYSPSGAGGAGGLGGTGPGNPGAAGAFGDRNAFTGSCP